MRLYPTNSVKRFNSVGTQINDGEHNRRISDPTEEKVKACIRYIQIPASADYGLISHRTSSMGLN